MTDIQPETKRTIVNDLITRWNNTLYQQAINQRVAKKIGDKDMEQRAVTEMTRCEMALDALKDELAELEADK